MILFPEKRSFPPNLESGRKEANRFRDKWEKNHGYDHSMLHMRPEELKDTLDEMIEEPGRPPG